MGVRHTSLVTLPRPRLGVKHHGSKQNSQSVPRAVPNSCYRSWSCKIFMRLASATPYGTVLSRIIRVVITSGKAGCRSSVVFRVSYDVIFSRRLFGNRRIKTVSQCHEVLSSWQVSVGQVRLGAIPSHGLSGCVSRRAIQTRHAPCGVFTAVKTEQRYLHSDRSHVFPTVEIERRAPHHPRQTSAPRHTLPQSLILAHRIRASSSSLALSSCLEPRTRFW